MAIEVDGKTIETTENGYLVDINDWSEAAAEALAKDEGLEMTERHWDVVKYLRASLAGESLEPVAVDDMD